jgi:type VI secretion system secreted protein Hcp
MKAKLFGCLFLALAMFASVPPAFAALNAYLDMTSEKWGRVQGSVTQKGREGLIMVIAYSHNISVSFDASSGMVTGQRKHEPLMITKEVDKSSPILHDMLASNEKIKDFTLFFWQPSASGYEQQYFTIRLTKARIVSIRSEMLNNKYPENMQHKEREHIFFSYETISWTSMDGGITASDTWFGAK